MRKRWSFGERERGVYILLLQTLVSGKIWWRWWCLLFLLLLTCLPSPLECLCWNFGGTGASSHTEYKIITLTFEAVSVFQMSQFGACLCSLWKAKFNGKKAGCLQVESLKWFFFKHFIIYSHSMYGPSSLHTNNKSKRY